MPPCARQPTTSYCPATTSPAASFGVNEKCAPQLRQNPSARPGVPSRERPTGSPHRAQKRRDSATEGAASTAPAGSRYGVGAIVTRPAPRGPGGGGAIVTRPAPRRLRVDVVVLRAAERRTVVAPAEGCVPAATATGASSRRV